MMNVSGKIGRGQRLGLLVALALAIIIVYIPSLRSPFVFDDVSGIQNNPIFRPSTSWKQLWWGNTKRYVANVTLALQIRHTGYDTYYLHIGNVLFHLLTTFGVYFLLHKLFPGRWFATTLGTAIYALHPIQTQAVNYISQRSAVMAGMFYVWAIVCFIYKGKQRRLEWCGFIFSFLAFLSKESSYTLPAMVGLVIFFDSQRRLSWRMIGTIFGVGMIAIVVYIATTFGNVAGIIKSPTDVLSTPNALHSEQLSSSSYFWTQNRALAKYLAMIALPTQQNIDHDFPLSSGILDRGSGVFLMFHLMLIGVGIYLFWKNEVTGLGILWFYLACAIESFVFPISDVFMEHRMYIPIVGWIISILGLWGKGANSKFALVVFLLWTAGLIAMTGMRNVVWASDLSLWRDAALKSPNKVRAQAGLGEMYAKYGEFEKAQVQFEKALQMSPERAHAYQNNLGLVFLRSGQLEKALAAFGHALEMEPADTYAMSNKAGVLVMQGKINEAIGIYQQILEIDDEDLGARKNLAVIYSQKGDSGKSFEILDEAEKKNAQDEDLYVIRGELWRKNLRAKEAIDNYMKALSINKFNANANYGMGVILLSLGTSNEIVPGLETNNIDALKGALMHLEIATKYDSQNKSAWLALAEVYKLMGLVKQEGRARENAQ